MVNYYPILLAIVQNFNDASLDLVVGKFDTM